jgi:ATP-dependent DNA helicase RecG
MTPERLRSLIAGGETLAVEFKGEERAPVNDRDLVEAVVCLANRSGTEPPAPSYARSDATGVVVSIPGGEANLDFVRLLVTEAQGGRGLRLDEMLILNSLWQGRSFTTEDAARLTQKPEAETRATLHRMVEAGLIEERGQKRGRTWHLSAAAYRALGDKAGYVRQRGFEPLQQEQMVLQYVEKHGRITRKEAAELCRLASHQARDLLARLVVRRELEMHGTKKGAFYERSPRHLEGSKSGSAGSKKSAK